MHDPEVLAIIRCPHLGCSDRGVVALQFQTYVSDASAASQWLFIETSDDDREKAWELLRTVDDVADLNGRPCWVRLEGGGQIIRYLRPAKAGA